MPPGVQNLLFGGLSGLLASTVFLLALFIGFCVVFGFPKLRATGKDSMGTRASTSCGDDRTAVSAADAPRGPRSLRTRNFSSHARKSRNMLQGLTLASGPCDAPNSNPSPA